MFTNKYLKIDLTKIKKLKHLKRILRENNVDIDRIDVNDIFNMRKGFLRVWIDVEACLPVYVQLEENIAKDYRNSLIMLPEYIEFLDSQQSVSLSKNETITKLSVDGILDKISKKGIESLTESEKSYLDDYSKK